MFRKVHLRLAGLCAGITILILAVMSCGCLYISEKSLKDNHLHAFTTDMELLCKNFSSQSLITPEWVHQAETSGNYSIYITDNERPLLFNRRLSAEETQLFADAWARYEELFSIHSSEPLYTVHDEFSFRPPRSSQNYYASAMISSRSSGSLRMMVLMPLTELSAQIHAQRIRFLLLDLLAFAALSLFSWHFTRRLLSPLEENQRRQSQFIASASHELRTPLAVILSCASAATCSEETDRRRFLSSITLEGIRMSKLIDDMLLLASADTHAWSVEKAPVDLDTLLLEVYDSFTPMAAQQEIQLLAKLPDDLLPSCVCSRERIRQVITILLQNALTYTPRGGFVRLSLSYANHQFQIRVEDNGIGIPDEQKAHIFERFYRADAARSQKEHFGLGLCIASEIANIHHGELQIEDTPGGGSTFVLLLPEG